MSRPAPPAWSASVSRMGKEPSLRARSRLRLARTARRSWSTLTIDSTGRAPGASALEECNGRRCDCFGLFEEQTVRSFKRLNPYVVLALRHRLEVSSLSSPKGCGQFSDPRKAQRSGATTGWVDRIEEQEGAADIPVDLEHVDCIQGGVGNGAKAVWN